MPQDAFHKRAAASFCGCRATTMDRRTCVLVLFYRAAASSGRATGTLNRSAMAKSAARCARRNWSAPFHEGVPHKAMCRHRQCRALNPVLHTPGHICDYIRAKTVAIGLPSADRLLRVFLQPHPQSTGLPMAHHTSRASALWMPGAARFCFRSFSSSDSGARVVHLPAAASPPRHSPRGMMPPHTLPRRRRLTICKVPSVVVA